jgi:REP element-mobilizing transposase RayT
MTELLEFDGHYHIFNHANGFEILFREDKNYQFFLQKYEKHISPIVETFSWCLMPNHFHILVRIKTKQEIYTYFEEQARLEAEASGADEFSSFENISKVSNFGNVEARKDENSSSKSNNSSDIFLPNGNVLDEYFLSKQFANFFSSYTQSFNKVYKRRGSLFIKNFKRKKVEDDTYFRNLIFYIQLNPIHHGFTSKALEWSWTSYLDFPEEFPELLQHYFGDIENYKWMHKQKALKFDEYEKIEADINE